MSGQINSFKNHTVCFIKPNTHISRYHHTQYKQYLFIYVVCSILWSQIMYLAFLVFSDSVNILIPPVTGMAQAAMGYNK